MSDPMSDAEAILDRHVLNLSQKFIKYSDEITVTMFGQLGCHGLRGEKGEGGSLQVDYYPSHNAYEPFRLYSLLWTILEHIMCKMLITVQFVAFEEEYYNKSTFILDPLPIEGNIADYGHLVVFDEIETVSILTALRLVKSEVYFSFVYLLDYKVWILLFISMLIMSYLIKKSSWNKITFYRALTDFYRTFTGQTSDSAHIWLRLRHGRWKRPLNFILMQTLLHITILACTVLSKSMTCLLLETYMNDIKVPIINSVEDIANNPGLQIEGEDLLHSFENESKYQAIWHKLETRLTNSERNKIQSSRGARSLNNYQTVESILNGELVLLDNSRNNMEKLLMFPSLPFTIAETKYYSTLYTFFINKHAPSAKLITKLVQHAIEAGFHQHMKRADELKSSLKGRIMRTQIGQDVFARLYEFDQDDHIVLELEDVTQGILLCWTIGQFLALILFCYELANYYVQNVFLNHDLNKINDVNNWELSKAKTFYEYELAKSFKLETIRKDEMVLKYAKRWENRSRTIHHKLMQNYDIYFA